MKAEFKLPEPLSNVFLNQTIAKMQAEGKEREILFNTFQIFNRHGISTEKYLEIIGEIQTMTAEVNSRYEECEE